MSSEEFKEQQAIINSVIMSLDDSTLDEWRDLVCEDYWYGLVHGGYLNDIVSTLKSKGANTDSIMVMDYFDSAVGA